MYETRDRIQRLSLGRYRDIKPLSEIVPDIPNYITAVVNRAMDLKPEKRFQSPADMLRELKNVKKRFDSGDLGQPSGSSSQVMEPADIQTDQLIEQEGENRRVMIVESSATLQDQFRNRLKRRGYRVLIVSNRQLAVQRFLDHLDSDPLADCIVINSQHLGPARRR